MFDFIYATSLFTGAVHNRMQQWFDEITRVLAPGGSLAILDFSEPGGVIGKLYAFYFRGVLPRIGRMLSGAGSAYTYLPASVGRFPAPPQMLATLESVGFHDARWTPYTFGIAGLYTARKP